MFFDNTRRRMLTSLKRIDLTLTGDFLSMGFMTNFLSLKEMFLISLQGKPIFGVNLKKGDKWVIREGCCLLENRQGDIKEK